MMEFELGALENSSLFPECSHKDSYVSKSREPHVCWEAVKAQDEALLPASILTLIA